MRFRRGQDRRRLLLGLENQLLELTYLLKDYFTTDEGAPLTVPRTAEPTGTWTSGLNAASMSIVGSKLRMSGSSSAFLQSSQTQAAGLAVAIAAMETVTGSPRRVSGWFASTAYYFAADTVNVLQTGGGSSPSIFTNAAANDIVLVLASSSQYAFENISGTWKLKFVSYQSDAVSLRATIRSITTDGFDTDTVFVSTLPAFTDSSFITDSLAGALSAGQTFTHEADGWLTFDLDTLPSSGTIDVFLRVQDASNYWLLQINSAGDMNLDEVVSATPTNRASAAAALAGGEKLRVMFESTTITGYYNNTQAWSYTSASNFQTETSGEVDALGTGGAASDLETLPRIASGAHLLNLQSIAAGS